MKNLKLSFCVFLTLLVINIPARATEKTGHHNLSYKIYGGGLHTIDVDVAINLNKSDYSIAMKGQTTPWLNYLVPWRDDINSKGKVKGAKLFPALHVASDTWREKTKITFLQYDGKGGFVKKWHAPPDNETVAVTDELTSDTVDLMTASLQIMKDINAGKGCTKKIPVFDGKRRFNLDSVDGGEDEIEKNRYSVYEGPATRCDITIEKIAGYWKAKQMKLTSEEDGGLVLSLWFAPLEPGGYAVPVRIQAKGVIGIFVAHLTESQS